MARPKLQCWLLLSGGGDRPPAIKKLLPRDYARRAGFSTRLVNQPYVSSLEELYVQANRAHQATKKELLTYFKGIQDFFVSKGVEILFTSEMTKDGKALQAEDEERETTLPPSTSTKPRR